MTLSVETGTGLADAESYLSVTGFKTYAAARGLAYEGSDDLIEQALRRATGYLDGRFRGSWKGLKTNIGQSLAWPRINVQDEDGYYLAGNALPRGLLSATAEAAARELADPGSLSPDFIAAQLVTKEKVGPIEVTYADGSSAGSTRPVVSIIDELLSGFVGGSPGLLTGRACRG